MDANITLTDQTLSVDAAIESVKCPEAGAVAVFIGTVRNNTQGRTVSGLEYQAYESMARSEIARLCDEAGRRWGVCRCAVAHRSGNLAIGEASVVIAVSAPHRAEAFDAARFLIDALKTTAPIWKKELYADGEASWVTGA